MQRKFNFETLSAKLGMKMNSDSPEDGSENSSDDQASVSHRHSHLCLSVPRGIDLTAQSEAFAKTSLSIWLQTDCVPWGAHLSPRRLEEGGIPLILQN